MTGDIDTRIPRLAALGGGHGLSATLRAARLVADSITAIVTVADDGGSSGRLRRELDILPPGDLRMALCALAGDSPDQRLLADVFQHRYGGTGALAGHAVGNLVYAGLWEQLEDPVAALDAVTRLLGCVGRVLPMSSRPLDIAAEVVGLERDPRVIRSVQGQVAVATTPGQVRRVRLMPSRPEAGPGVVEAIDSADVVVLGPGSWFTSVIPHVLVPDIAAALRRTTARRVVVLNLAPQTGETAGFSAERHLHVLAQHDPDLLIDDIIVDPRTGLSAREFDHLDRAARNLGARIHVADVAATRPDGSMRPVHDPGSLARALVEVAGNDDSDGDVSAGAVGIG